MNKNKNGFTLVELLAVMAIIAMISIIAVPNVIKIMNGNKQSKVLNDGLTLIALAKQEVASSIDLRESLTETGITRSLQRLDDKNDLTVDPDGILYDRTNSYVQISKVSGTIMYCVYLKSNNWSLNNSGNCVYEDMLLSDDGKDYVKIVES